MMRGIVESELCDGVGSAWVTSCELMDERTVSSFREGLDDLVTRGAHEIELDLSRIQILSSSAICVVIDIDRRLRERGGRLRLRKVHAGCLEVFSHMRLHELLDIQSTADAEVRATA